MNPLKWGDNEKALVRFVRYLVFGALSAGAVWLINNLGSTDIPGEWDAVVIAVVVPALAGLDKLLRSAQ